MMRRSDILLAEKTLLYTRERVLLLGLFCFFLSSYFNNFNISDYSLLSFYLYSDRLYIIPVK